MDQEVILIDDDPKQAFIPALANRNIYERAKIVSKKRKVNIIPATSLEEVPSSKVVKLVQNRTLPGTTGHIFVKPAGSSVVIDGGDVYYVQEIEESGQDSTLIQHDMSHMVATTIVPSPTTKPSSTAVTHMVGSTDDFYAVEPLELSEVWNDLISANQEVLILLELQDLKHYIVDARRIEDRLSDLVCEYCSLSFPNLRACDAHIRKVHFQTELFQCESCEGQFKYFFRFKDHINTHSGSRPYQCDECPHQYAFRIGFLVHKILDHMKLNGIYVCPKCKLDCGNAQNYKLHIAKHMNVAPSQKSHSAIPHATGQISAGKNTEKAIAEQPTADRSVVPNPAKYNNDRTNFMNVFEMFSNRVMKERLPNRRWVKNSKT